MKMMVRILLLQLESEMDEVPIMFSISDIQSVCRMCQRQCDLWK